MGFSLFPQAGESLFFARSSIWCSPLAVQQPQTISADVCVCLGMLAENPGTCSLDYDPNVLLAITPLLAPLTKANEDIIKFK